MWTSCLRMHKIFWKYIRWILFHIKHLRLVPMCIYHVVLQCTANPWIRLVLIYTVRWSLAVKLSDQDLTRLACMWFKNKNRYPSSFSFKKGIRYILVREEERKLLFVKRQLTFVFEVMATYTSRSFSTPHRKLKHASSCIMLANWIPLQSVTNEDIHGQNY